MAATRRGPVSHASLQQALLMKLIAAHPRRGVACLPPLSPGRENIVIPARNSSLSLHRAQRLSRLGTKTAQARKGARRGICIIALRSYFSRAFSRQFRNYGLMNGGGVDSGMRANPRKVGASGHFSEYELAAPTLFISFRGIVANC